MPKKIKENSALASAAEKVSREIGKQDIVYILDPEHKYAFLFGNASKPKCEILGKTEDKVHSVNHERAFSGERVAYEWHLDCGGREHYYQTILTPLINTDGKVANVLGVVKDISEVMADPESRHLVMENKGKTLAQMLLAVREQEKKSISSALHDELGSTAVLLSSMLGIIEEDIKENKDADALARIKQLDKKFKNAVEKIKNVLVSIRPQNLESAGLEGAAEEFLEQTREATGLDIAFSYKENGENYLRDEIKIIFYRVIQESVNNIIKHSGADKAEVSIENLKNEVRVTVKDNGKGFKTSSPKSIKQLGLTGMKESVKSIGGKIQIKSSLGKGTEITASAPKAVYK